MNSALFVGFIDDFVTKIKQKTIIILDNAPFHHGKVVKDKIEQWAKKDL
ncbi:MAG: superfamily endonuclease [Bacteroidota bacterium]|jgi:16S rRNA G1207 methylase RsmC